MSNDIRIIQLKELDIVRAFVQVCNDNDLTYYMVGGTLLGAARHKGFIPWDDDMDFAMPRADYERFLEGLYKQLPEHIKVDHFRFDPSVYFYPLKLMNTEVKVTERRLEKFDQVSYLSIDVFPVDGLPNNWLKRKLYKLKFYYYKMMIGFCNVDRLRTNVKRSAYEKILIRFAEVFQLNKRLSLTKIRNKYDRFLKKNSREHCDLIGDITGRYGFREFVPRGYFGTPKKLPFEDLELAAPARYDDYLRHIYGDYMKLPPEEDRVSDHLMIVRG